MSIKSIQIVITRQKLMRKPRYSSLAATPFKPLHPLHKQKHKPKITPHQWTKTNKKQNFNTKSIKKKKKRTFNTKFTSEAGLCDGSDICGLNRPDLDNRTLFFSLPLTFSLKPLSWSTSNSFFTLEGGKSLISHNVAASFLAETESSLSLEGNMEPEECNKGFVWCCCCCCCRWVGTEGEELVLVFHMGTGVLDPPFFPTKMALLKRYLLTKEEEEDEEQPRFLVLLLRLLLVVV